MDAITKNLKNFLDRAHSVYHAVAALKEMLDAAGYTPLTAGAAWALKRGGKYYMVKGGTALVAFRIPENTPVGFMLSASHSDRPTFKLKENGEITGKYTRLSTEKYGGMLIAPWLDRPLSVAGRVLVDTPEGVTTRLVDIDRDLMLIPNVAIHMNRNANESASWNPAVDTLPLLGGEAAAGKLQRLLEEAAGGKLLGHDLYLYVRQQASIWGVEEEYISSAALDDLMCAWCCTRGFLEAKESRSVPVLCVFDSEEVGSCSMQGADSTLLASVLAQIAAGLKLPLEGLLANSFILSADNAHAVHPNHPEYADPNNAPLMGKGVVVKFNANQRYTTDGLAYALLCKLSEKAGVPLQTYYNRADLPGGSTLGAISLRHVSVLSADIGLAQLAMHSSYETAAVADAGHLVRLMAAFYGSTLENRGDTCAFG